MTWSVQWNWLKTPKVGLKNSLWLSFSLFFCVFVPSLASLIANNGSPKRYNGMFQKKSNWLQFFKLAGNTEIWFKKIVSCLAWAYFFVFLCQVWRVWQQTPGLQRDAMACLKNHPNGLLPCWNLFQQANRRKKETQFCVIPSPKQTKNQIDIHWKKKKLLSKAFTL